MVNLLFYGGAFWMACVLFTVDLLFPVSPFIGLGYAGVVWVGVWSPSRKYFYWAALAGSILILFGYFVSPLTETLEEAAVKRLIAAAMPWAAAIFLTNRAQKKPDEYRGGQW